jgi:hypothetical protein
LQHLTLLINILTFDNSTKFIATKVNDHCPHWDSVTWPYGTLW